MPPFRSPRKNTHRGLPDLLSEPQATWPILAERSQKEQCFQSRAAGGGPSDRDIVGGPFYGCWGACYQGQPVRRAIEVCLPVVALMLLGYAHAQPTDNSLRIYAVDIWQDPPQSWGPGRGVYLGKGLVITAAHVVTPVARTKPRVRSGRDRLNEAGILAGLAHVSVVPCSERLDIESTGVRRLHLPWNDFRRWGLLEERIIQSI
jgi:hypothetical protein